MAKIKNKSSEQKRQQQRIDESILGKAVKALIKHHTSTVGSQEKPDLLGTDTVVQLQIGLEVAPARSHVKPIRIIIPHPFRKVSGSDDSNYDLVEPEVCLIVKEESKPWVQEMISQFPEHMSCIKKVLGLQSLRTKHKQYNQRRELLHKYNVFMADDRILPMLTTALGKDFFKAKKQPVPVRLTRKEALPFAIQNAMRATFMTIPKGTCVMVPIGMTNMSVDNLTANVTAASMEAVEKIPRKWANIRSLCLKTPESVALPFYNKTPAELVEIAQLAGLKPIWKEGGAEEEKREVDAAAAAESKEEKKKRTLAAAAKSPLVRALKKQKKTVDDEQQEADSKNDKHKEKDHSSSKKLKKKQHRSDGDDDGGHHVEENKTKKHKKKEAATSAEDGLTRNDEKKQEKQPKQSFIPSKKFKGSKKGYAFKKETQGLGYYIDAKPEVDTMALEAIFRMAEQQQKSGNRHKKKKGSHKKKHRR